jgi:hypothetical protein
VTTPALELVDAGDLEVGDVIHVGECHGPITEVIRSRRVLIAVWLCEPCGVRHWLSRKTWKQVSAEVHSSATAC